MTVAAPQGQWKTAPSKKTPVKKVKGKNISGTPMPARPSPPKSKKKVADPYKTYDPNKFPGKGKK